MPRSASALGPRARRVHHVCRAVVLALLPLWHVLTRRRPVARRPDRVTFVLHNAFGMGGTIRSVVTQANVLARRGLAVEVLSVTHSGPDVTPFFTIDPAVRVRLLDDPRADRSLPTRVLRRALRDVPSLLFHPDESRGERMSAWRDVLLVAALRRVRAGTVVGTRAALNDVVARVARRRLVLVGQEHVPLDSYTPALRDELARSYRQLDAVMVLTGPDAVALRDMLGGAATRVEVVPNPLPDVDAVRADPGRHRIVTAGRFSRNKRQDLLLRAFARLADDHPDWDLVLYGKGPRERRLHRQVDRLGLGERVHLPGASRELARDLADGSVFALTSQYEAFGIVLIEAMQAGMAVLATDCPHGPREIVTDEVDGLLVPSRDLDAITGGLRRLMDDADLRRRLGEAAVVASHRYDPEVLVERWLEVLDAAAVVRGRRRSGARAG